MAAERENAGRFVVQGDEMLTAFLELQAMIHRRIRVGWSIRKSSPTISATPDGVGAVAQRLILTGERSGLLTRIASP